VNDLSRLDGRIEERYRWSLDDGFGEDREVGQGGWETRRAVQVMARVEGVSGVMT